jgi:hypothetical protein
MIVNGLQLPVVFVRLYQAIRDGKLPPYWVLKERVDAYGYPWKAKLELFDDLERIKEHTAYLSQGFIRSSAFSSMQSGMVRNQASSQALQTSPNSSGLGRPQAENHSASTSAMTRRRRA